MKKAVLIGWVATLAAASFGVVPENARVVFVPQPQMRIGGFWAEKLDLLERNWLPHCGRMIAREAHRLGPMNHNYVEALALALERNPANAPLRRELETAILRDLASQQPDGYVGNRAPHERYRDLDSHEFYDHGYFIEAGVRVWETSGGADARYLDAAVRLADHLDATFGPAPKRTWTNGHPGLEKALLTLSDCMARKGDSDRARRYANLSRHFIEHQHDDPSLRRDYCQSHLPARDLSVAWGHAVRATYFYTAMIGVETRCGATDLGAASRRLFANAIDCKGYITGGVGAKWEWEAFHDDFNLTNGNGYLEGCASCGMYDWCTELTLADGPGRSEDVRERLMYNLLLGVFNADFTAYAYPNPPNATDLRAAWHTIPCCVANVPRVLEDYRNRMWAVSRTGETLYLNHFIASTKGAATVAGEPLRLDLATAYPEDGRMTLEVTSLRPVAFDLRVRYPDRAESRLYKVSPEVEHGYRSFAVRTRFGADGKAHTKVAFELPMPLQRITCDARVAANRGLVAWQRGPTVYSWEGAGFGTRVPYRDRLNRGGSSKVWIAAEGQTENESPRVVPWPCGNPIDADGKAVPHALLLK